MTEVPCPINKKGNKRIRNGISKTLLTCLFTVCKKKIILGNNLYFFSRKQEQTKNDEKKVVYYGRKERRKIYVLCT